MANIRRQNAVNSHYNLHKSHYQRITKIRFLLLGRFHVKMLNDTKYYIPSDLELSHIYIQNLKLVMAIILYLNNP